MPAFKRFIQVEKRPNPVYGMPVKKTAEPYVPSADAYKTSSDFKSLMDAAYLPGQGPTKFAGLFAEADEYLRACIRFSEGGEVLILSELGNKKLEFGEKGPFDKVEDLVARVLGNPKIVTAKINLIVFADVCSGPTHAAICAVHGHAGWMADTWAVPQTAERVKTMNATEHGQTAASIARTLNKNVTDVYTGAVGGNLAIAFGLGAAAARPAPGTRPPAVPRVPAIRVAPARKKYIEGYTCKCCFLA